MHTASLAPAGTGKWLLIDAATAAGYGMSEQDILRAVTLTPAEILGVSAKTVMREWQVAKMWLLRELRQTSAHGSSGSGR